MSQPNPYANVYDIKTGKPIQVKQVDDKAFEAAEKAAQAWLASMEEENETQSG